MSNGPEVAYPREDLPVVFADGIANFANSNEVFKLYLYRQDPSTTGKGPPASRMAAQIIMPLSGLLGSVAFLNAAIADLVKTNPVVAKAWAEAERFQAETFKSNNTFPNG